MTAYFNEIACLVEELLWLVVMVVSFLLSLFLVLVVLSRFLVLGCRWVVCKVDLIIRWISKVPWFARIARLGVCLNETIFRQNRI